MENLIVLEKIARRLAFYLIKNQYINKELYEVYLYGFQMAIELITSFIASLFIAIILNMIPECLVFFCVFIPLRSYAGGIHLDNYCSCFICSCITLGGILLLVKNVQVPLLFSLIILLSSLIIIKGCGTVENKNRRTDVEEEKYFKRKLEVIMILLIIMGFIILLCRNSKFEFLLASTVALVAISLVFGKMKYNIDCKRNK